MKPKVDILMPVYNNEKYIKGAVESILNQTYSNYHLYIVDDASRDRTLEIIQKYSSNNKITIISNNKRLGLPANLNKLIRRSTSKYIARMDGDDISEPERLEKQVVYLEENPSIGLLGTEGIVIDESGNKKADFHRPVTDWKIRAKLMQGNAFIHGSVMIRKKVLDRTNLYEEKYERGQDYPLWLEIIKLSKVANLPEKLYCWREYGKSREDNRENMLKQSRTHQEVMGNITRQAKYLPERFLLMSYKVLKRFNRK